MTLPTGPPGRTEDGFLLPHLMDDRQRRAMEALVATGHYDETPDAFEWLFREAQDLARVTATGSAVERVDAVVALLVDTAFHDPTDEHEAQCLRADADVLVGALA